MGVESRVKHWVETATADYGLILTSSNGLLSCWTSSTWSMSQQNSQHRQQKSAHKA